MKENFFKKMGAPEKDPSTLDPDYLKYKLRGYSYYRQNMEKVKQSMRDRRLAFNKALPPLNLICAYCNKLFVLPGMKENGHKQQPVRYCRDICMDRAGRLRKLWVPKWLYNFYLDKKLFRIKAGFKQSKHSIFSPKRQLYGLRNLNFHNFFVLWHPNSFLRKKYKWINKLISSYQKNKRDKYIKNYRKLYHTSEEFRSRHMKMVRAWQKRQPKDSNYYISTKFRSTIIGALKRQGVRKSRRTEELLGTDRATARVHIENLFKPGMSWENHGKWHLDHIIPCASFDLKCPVQQLACCYYKNLQPLWAVDNIKKGAKLEYDARRSRKN